MKQRTTQCYINETKLNFGGSQGLFQNLSKKKKKN